MLSPTADHIHYGNTGCGVFKRGMQNWKGFWLKINCSQRKLPNFDNWSNGELSKIGYHFRKKSELKMCPLLVVFNEKKTQKDSDDFDIEN